MTRRRPSWERYRAFLAVLRAGSLSAASRSLGVRQSTVGRQIEALEAELGVPLFTRSPSGLRPTATALRLRPHLDALDTVTEALVRDAGVEDTSHGGTIARPLHLPRNKPSSSRWACTRAAATCAAEPRRAAPRSSGSIR